MDSWFNLGLLVEHMLCTWKASGSGRDQFPALNWKVMGKTLQS